VDELDELEDDRLGDSAAEEELLINNEDCNVFAILKQMEQMESQKEPNGDECFRGIRLYLCVGTELFEFELGIGNGIDAFLVIVAVELEWEFGCVVME